MLTTVAVARSSSDDNAMRYVQRQRYVSTSSPGGGTGGEVACYDCRLVTLAMAMKGGHVYPISHQKCILIITLCGAHLCVH